MTGEKAQKRVARRLQWKKGKVYQNEAFRVNKKEQDYNHRCCVCGIHHRIRFDEDCGFICEKCYVDAGECSCGKVAIIGNQCRDCYFGDDEVDYNDVAWAKQETVQPNTNVRLTQQEYRNMKKMLVEAGVIQNSSFHERSNAIFQARRAEKKQMHGKRAQILAGFSRLKDVEDE